MKDIEREKLVKIIEELKQENIKLKEKLYGKPKEVIKHVKNISSEEKIKIFEEIFNGRRDIYAKRWTSSKTGKSGYSPVCANEFSEYKCDKPRIKCADCPYRELLPLTDKIIRKHLQGEITIGIYPLLQGDLCNFLVIDFDKKTYKQDVMAFWNTCDELAIPIYVERSRSGNGAHIWIFFEQSVPAKLARKMGNILITKTMEKKSLDLDSYDRIFPNQDIIPKGGFGNLIALPFQGESAKLGNTVFVNRDFQVIENQMEVLLNIRKITNDEIYEFINRYRDDDYKEFDIQELENEEELPKKETIKDIVFLNNIQCIIENQIYINKSNLLPREITYLKRLASFTNPKFYELQKLRMPIFYETTPRIISCFEEEDKYIILPRGCMDKIKEVCKKSEVKLMIKDKRENGVLTDYQFKGKLNKKQEKAKEQLLLYDMGVLSAATGFGKTVIAAKIISELKTNALIIVNRTTLLEQWKEKLSYFLGIPKKEIGQMGNGKDKLNGRLDIASFQSLYKKEDLEQLVKDYGLVIIDECHHVAAFSFEKVLKTIRAKHVYGLTATPTRKDGWHKIIYMQCGDVRCRIYQKDLKSDGSIEHKVIVRKTHYQYIPAHEIETISFSEILNDMSHNELRNKMILQDVKQSVAEGRIPIILTERLEHLKVLKQNLEELKVPVVIYKGNMGKKKTKEMQEIIQNADKNHQSRIILATSSSIGEGFDDSRLDTLFLTMPVSWKGRIIQYVGRLHREYVNKEKIIVYDYLDNMRILEKMYNKRIKGYKVSGYEIEE